jgi:hypothetical protein
MDALDGNAIAGELFELYGREMTTSVGACATCGATARIGELRVYVRAPGTVVRCSSCWNVVMVIVTVHGNTQIDAGRFSLRDQERR